MSNSILDKRYDEACKIVSSFLFNNQKDDNLILIQSNLFHLKNKDKYKDIINYLEISKFNDYIDKNNGKVYNINNNINLMIFNEDNIKDIDFINYLDNNKLEFNITINQNKVNNYPYMLVMNNNKYKVIILSNTTSTKDVRGLKS